MNHAVGERNDARHDHHIWYAYPMTTPTPGWYPNPDGSGSQRYWDGQAWQQVAATEPPKAKVSNRKSLIVAAGLVAILALLVGGLALLPNDGQERYEAKKAAEAQAEAADADARAASRAAAAAPVNAELLCEEAVTNRLKSPSTADFPDKHNTRAVGNGYEVRGVVDSQNALGATVRSYFGCTVVPASVGQYTVTVTELFEP